MVSIEDTPRRKRQKHPDQPTATRLSGPTSPATSEKIRRFHTHPNPIPPGHCSSLHIKHISAPLPVVWSLISRFSRPQSYKPFVHSCHLRKGDGSSIGSVRQIRVVSGLPATSSTERLDVLDHEQHVFGFSIVGGDHRLCNYRSTMTAHSEDGRTAVVVESYVAEVPEGNTQEETCVFVDTIVGCNLRSLAYVAEKMVSTAPPPTA